MRCLYSYKPTYINNIKRRQVELSSIPYFFPPPASNVIVHVAMECAYCCLRGIHVLIEPHVQKVYVYVQLEKKYKVLGLNQPTPPNENPKPGRCGPLCLPTGRVLCCISTLQRWPGHIASPSRPSFPWLLKALRGNRTGHLSCKCSL